MMQIACYGRLGHDPRALEARTGNAMTADLPSCWPGSTRADGLSIGSSAAFELYDIDWRDTAAVAGHRRRDCQRKISTTRRPAEGLSGGDA